MAERDKKVKEEYEKAKPFSRAGRMRAAGVAMGTIKKQAADRKAEARKIAEGREAKKGRPGARAGTTPRGGRTSPSNISPRRPLPPFPRNVVDPQSTDTRRGQLSSPRSGNRAPTRRRT